MWEDSKTGESYTGEDLKRYKSVKYKMDRFADKEFVTGEGRAWTKEDLFLLKRDSTLPYE